MGQFSNLRQKNAPPEIELFLFKFWGCASVWNRFFLLKALGTAIFQLFLINRKIRFGIFLKICRSVLIILQRLPIVWSCYTIDIFAVATAPNFWVGHVTWNNISLIFAFCTFIPVAVCVKYGWIFHCWISGLWQFCPQPFVMDCNFSIAVETSSPPAHSQHSEQ